MASNRCKLGRPSSLLNRDKHLSQKKVKSSLLDLCQDVENMELESTYQLENDVESSSAKNGASLPDLCDDDKHKVSALIHKVMAAYKEIDHLKSTREEELATHVSLVEKLRSQNQEVVDEVAHLRLKVAHLQAQIHMQPKSSFPMVCAFPVGYSVSPLSPIQEDGEHEDDDHKQAKCLNKSDSKTTSLTKVKNANCNSLKQLPSYNVDITHNEEVKNHSSESGNGLPVDRAKTDHKDAFQDKINIVRQPMEDDSLVLKRAREDPRPLPNFHVIMPITKAGGISTPHSSKEESVSNFTNKEAPCSYSFSDKDISSHTHYYSPMNNSSNMQNDRPPWNSSFVCDTQKTSRILAWPNQATVVEVNGAGCNVCISEKGFPAPAKRCKRMNKMKEKFSKYPKWPLKSERTMIKWTPTKIEETSCDNGFTRQNYFAQECFDNIIDCSKRKYVASKPMGHWNLYDISLLDLVNELETDRVMYKYTLQPQDDSFLPERDIDGY